jgi:hypothetical protein
MPRLFAWGLGGTFPTSPLWDGFPSPSGPQNKPIIVYINNVYSNVSPILLYQKRILETIIWEGLLGCFFCHILFVYCIAPVAPWSLRLCPCCSPQSHEWPTAPQVLFGVFQNDAEETPRTSRLSPGPVRRKQNT